MRRVHCVSLSRQPSPVHLDMNHYTRRSALAALSTLTMLALAGCGGGDEAAAFDGYAYSSRYVPLAGGRMHYVDEGRGTPVVMLHGVPVWSYVWRDIIPYVTRSHRAIAPDMFNHGKSDKNQLTSFADHYTAFEQFVDALGLTNMILVLHDWGASVGFLYAARHPDKVKGLVFFEAMLGPAPSLDAFPPPVLAMRGPNGPGMVVKQNFFLEQMLPQLSLRPLPAHVLAAYKAPFANESDRLQLLQWPREIPVIGDGSPNLPAFGQYAQFLMSSPLPKLLIHADPGVLITAPAVQFAMQSYPKLDTASIGAGAHLLQEDTPDALGQTIANWLVAR